MGPMIKRELGVIRPTRPTHPSLPTRAPRRTLRERPGSCGMRGKRGFLLQIMAAEWNAGTFGSKPRILSLEQRADGFKKQFVQYPKPYLSVRFFCTSTCGLVAMTSASHAEGRQFDPGQVYVGLALV